jgi:hypothetical protein
LRQPLNTACEQHHLVAVVVVKARAVAAPIPDEAPVITATGRVSWLDTRVLLWM